ncbi:uncharacterized protein FTJAE_8874 [Fusarium tjaetaba]|uniref:Amidoligase enzyme-domain-containing protein n=1 Tax=Fusarium tjaetaba TaxID=1567544 RepID=A0A8H5R7Q1_9HYPO|nr:uncharacterized protein FTJAE_8874 [Fusarium tjaetaba]KAF5628257.1 hypothetical protein FTJAE_8874 [Fusarium tjaetaba]
MELSAINRNPLGAPASSGCSTASLLSSLRNYHHIQVDKHFHRREKTPAIPASLEPMMLIPQSICVGIELEFMVALQIPNSDAVTGETRWSCPTTPEAFLGLVMGDYKDIEPSCIHKVCELIASSGVSVSCSLIPPSPSSPAHIPGTTILPLTDNSGDIRTWNNVSVGGPVSKSDFWYIVPERHITRDCVSKSGMTPSNRYDWYGTELNSPILTRPEEFSQGLPTLRKCLAAVQGDMVLGLNSGCGLHLHVNEAGSMQLETALRLASLVWLLEDSLLYPLCHPFRSTSPYSARISVESRIAMERGEPTVYGEGAALVEALGEVMRQLHWRKKVDRGLLGAMKRLWSENSLVSLGIALRKFDEGSLHTTTRCALVVSKHDTIEFRYPESTFDVDFIAGWADLVRHLYAVAMRPQVEFHRILCRVYELVTRDQMPGWSAMLGAIGFQGDVSRWQRHINEYGDTLSNLDKQGILPNIGQ